MAIRIVSSLKSRIKMNWFRLFLCYSTQVSLGPVCCSQRNHALRVSSHWEAIIPHIEYGVDQSVGITEVDTHMAGGIVSVFISCGLSVLYKMFRYFIEVLCAGGCVFLTVCMQMQLRKYIRILWGVFEQGFKLKLSIHHVWHSLISNNYYYAL